MPNATTTDIKRMQRQLRDERRSGIRAKDIERVPLTGGDWLDRYLSTRIGTPDAMKCLNAVHRLGLSLPSRDRQVLGDEE